LPEPEAKENAGLGAHTPATFGVFRMFRSVNGKLNSTGSGKQNSTPHGK